MNGGGAGCTGAAFSGAGCTHAAFSVGVGLAAHVLHSAWGGGELEKDEKEK